MCSPVRRIQSLVDLKSYYYIRSITTTNTDYQIKKQTSQNVSSDSKDPILGTFTCWSITTTNTYYQKNDFFCFANIRFRIICLDINVRYFVVHITLWYSGKSCVTYGTPCVRHTTMHTLNTQVFLYAQFSYTRYLSKAEPPSRCISFK